MDSSRRVVFSNPNRSVIERDVDSSGSEQPKGNFQVDSENNNNVSFIVSGTDMHHLNEKEHLITRGLSPVTFASNSNESNESKLHFSVDSPKLNPRRSKIVHFFLSLPRFLSPKDSLRYQKFPSSKNKQRSNIFCFLGFGICIILCLILFIHVYDTENIMLYIVRHFIQPQKSISRCGLKFSDFKLHLSSLHRTHMDEDTKEPEINSVVDSSFTSKILNIPLIIEWVPTITLNEKKVLNQCYESKLPEGHWFNQFVHPFDDTSNFFNTNNNSISTVLIANTLDATLQKINNRLTVTPFPSWPLVLFWRQYSQLMEDPICSEFEYGLNNEIYDETIELFYEFLKIVDDLNLKWFAESGLLIGSLRHYDIIPWDDDVDVRMFEPDWEKMYSAWSHGKYPHLGFTITGFGGHCKGKLWKKTASITHLMRPWKFPFIDIWVYTEHTDKETNQTHYKFEEPPYPVYQYTDLFPLHQRPFGPFWILVPNNAIHVYHEELPHNPHPERIVDLCVGSDFNHKTENWKIHTREVHCLSIAERIPLVTKRYSRTLCPYQSNEVLHPEVQVFSYPCHPLLSNSHCSNISSTIQKKSEHTPVSRLLQCFGRPQSSDTLVIMYNNGAETYITPSLLTMNNGKNSEYEKLPLWWSHWNFSTIHPLSVDDTQPLKNWPLVFVWECPPPTIGEENLSLSDGIIEEFSLGGIPIGIVEICSGNYRNVPLSTL